MALTREEVKAIAEERGYDLVISGTDTNWYSFINDRGINLQVWTETEQFQLTKMYNFIEVTSGKRGAFLNEDHFIKFEDNIIAAIRALNNRGIF
jgi:hypothetical protein